MSTFVLIHGAYQGGWIWQRVARELRARGHDVFTPTLDGCAERAGALRAGITTETHAEEIVRQLFFEDLDDVVLVGTSSGGMVMARAAQEAPERVARLVFADALALFDGEKITDIVSRAPPIVTELSRGPSPEDAATRLFAGLDGGIRDWATERITLHPIGVFEQPVQLERFWDMPWNASVLYCSEAQNPGKAHIERAAQRLGARWHEFATGHYPMLSTPDSLVDLIVDG